MGYKYQMHTHTAPCSKCGAMSPEELCRALYEGGFAGCVLTNHFMKGNSGIDRSLPWEEFVGAYERDYTECKKAAKKYGLDVIFSIEEHVGGGREILCYGITPAMLYKNPQLANGKIEDWSALLHENDALCIQAHPFRERAYITDPGAFSLDLIDGIEVFNIGNTPEANEAAEDFSQKNPSLIFTAGADAHRCDSVCLCALEFPERISDEEALVASLRKKDFKIIK